MIQQRGEDMSLGGQDREMAVASRASRRAMADLMIDFESIGGSCEFGVVQRCCGAEPLGLFRFAGSSINNLVHLLQSGLDGFMSPEDIVIKLHGSEREYMISSRRYEDFLSHTNAFAERHVEAAILSREIKKVAYLKSRFEADWRDAARIYVHCGCEDEGTILRLHAALRTRSDCMLLWVVKARSPEERGMVEVRGSGLFRGFLAHYGTFDGGPRLDLPGWAMICRGVAEIVHGSSEQLPLPPNTIAAGFRWSRAPCGMLEATSKGGRGRVLYTTTHCVSVGCARVEVELPDKSLVVFSVWVRLPHAFRGRQVLLVVDDAKSVNHHRADVSVRDTWQQLWVVARCDGGKDALHFSFYVEAARGAEFEFAGWQIEEGAIATERLRPTEQWIFEHPAPTPGPSKGLHQLRKRAAAALRQAARRVQPPEVSFPPTVEGMTGDAILRAADSLLRIRLFNEADGLLRAGKALFPWHAELFTHHALCAQIRGDRIEATDRWREVVDVFPQFALGHYSLSTCLREAGTPEQALEIVGRALRRHSDDVRMVSEAARLYAAVGRWADAVSCWDQALALDGDHQEWREARATASAQILEEKGAVPS